MPGHFDGNIRAKIIELFYYQIEAGIANCLQQKLALNPKGAAVVPGRPAAIFRIAECALIAKFRKPAAGKPLMLGQKRQFMRGGRRILERNDPR